ncbi:MAG: hypothetical protein AB1805_15035 [Nitrospirota bacterium]
MALFIVLLFAGSAAPGQAGRGSGQTATQGQKQVEYGPPERLIGTWMSNEPVDVDQPGSARIKVSFREEGKVRVVAWSTLPLVGKVKTTKGPYHVKNNEIISKAIRGGTAVRYWFEDGQLAIEYKPGQVVRFHRVDDKGGE